MEGILVQVGDARAAVLPDDVIAEYGLGEKFELVRTREGILIKAARRGRHGWEDQFAAAAAAGHTELSEEERDWMAFGNNWDKTEQPW